jgi:hypothetical protein
MVFGRRRNSAYATTGAICLLCLQGSPLIRLFSLKLFRLFGIVDLLWPKSANYFKRAFCDDFAGVIFSDFCVVFV